MVLVKTNTFELRVVLGDGAYFAYRNPSATVCIQLSDCPNWGAASSVMFYKLPANWHVSFFQSDKCVGKSGDDVHFTSDTKTVNGVHHFNTPRRIRSIYARPVIVKLSWSVARRCVQFQQPVKRGEFAVAFDNETESDSADSGAWTIVESNTNGDLSSNWFEPIEDEYFALSGAGGE